MSIDETEDPASAAADAFLYFTSGLTLDQMARAVDLIADGLIQAREDAREIADELRATRKLLESEG